ncbi:MAG: hypothetical protein ACRDGJ_03135 [Candidatus Limnocylindria bacterium]
MADDMKQDQQNKDAEESGKPVQLDKEKDKGHEQQGGQGGQKPQQGGQQHQGGQGGQQHQGGQQGQNR